jgi:hypothetical protein
VTRSLPGLNLAKSPSTTEVNRWESLEGIHKALFCPRRFSAGKQTISRRRKPVQEKGGGFRSPTGLPGQPQDVCGGLVGTPRHHTPGRSHQKPLQSVGKHPCGTFKAAGALCSEGMRVPGALANAGEEMDFDNISVTCGGLPRTPQYHTLPKTPTEIVARRWKSLEDVPVAIARPR